MTGRRGASKKSGTIRWQIKLSFYTMGAIKGGLLLRRSGTWHLTPEAEKR